MENLKTVDSENWVDLKIGDKALVKGYMTCRKGATTILVGQPDWSDVVIDLTDEGGMSPFDIRLSRVEVTVERTEDGLQASVKDIVYTG